MNVFDAVRTLLAVRRYQDRPIPDELVRRIVDAGRLTASANNRQPWHFVVVRDRDRLRELGKLVQTGPYIADAQLAIAVGCEKAWPPGVSDASRGTEALRRRIEQTRALPGHALRCSDCDRLSSGRATGWTMHRGEGGRLFAFCPDCDERELG